MDVMLIPPKWTSIFKEQTLIKEILLLFSEGFYYIQFCYWKVESMIKEKG